MGYMPQMLKLNQQERIVLACGILIQLKKNNQCSEKNKMFEIIKMLT